MTLYYVFLPQLTDVIRLALRDGFIKAEFYNFEGASMKSMLALLCSHTESNCPVLLSLISPRIVESRAPC